LIGGLMDASGDPATVGKSSRPTPAKGPAADCALSNGNAQSSPAEKMDRFFEIYVMLGHPLAYVRPRHGGAESQRF
jgi:hypothetical protein